MRKVLSFVLVLALVLGSFSMAFAATPTDVVGTPNAEAVQVLMGLGVVNGYTDGSFKPAGIVTRAEMAKLIVVALGLQDYATGTSKFADMAGAAWAQGYVNYAAGLEIIKGYPDGTFKPSQTVSYTEAATMIVRALGYTDASLLPATWPANYVVKAKSLDIFKDVNKSITAGATRGDIAQMLYNTLPLSIGSINKDGVWEASKTDTMLARLGTTPVDEAIITGLEKTTINLIPYVGTMAKTWKTSDGIVAVEVTSDSLTGKFNAAHDTFTANSVDYTVSSLATKAAIDYFYNSQPGTATSYGAISTSSEVALAVDLSGKTIKDIYSISKWTASPTKLYVASDYTEITADKSLDNVKFTLDDNDAIDLNSFALVGAASLKDIKVDNVVYVYRAANKITKIEVGTLTVTGKVTLISGSKYTIAGTAYKISDTPYSATAPVLGDSGKAYLDASGKIYKWVKDDNTSGNYGLVFLTSAGINGDQIQLVNKAGDKVTYSVDKNAYESSAQTIASFAKGDLISYSLDSAGVIDTITKLTRTTTLAGIVSDSGRFVSGKTIAADAVIFTTTSIAGMTATLTEFDVSSIADIAKVTLTTSYYYSKDAGIVKVLIILNTNTKTNDSYAVFNNNDQTLNADGDKVNLLSGFMDGKAVSLLTDKSATSPGALGFTSDTLYTVALNANGVATNVVTTGAGVGVTVTDKDGTTFVKDAGGAWYSIASNAVVYELNLTDEEYTLKTMDSVSVNNGIIRLWETDSDYDGYDIVIIVKN